MTATILVVDDSRSSRKVNVAMTRDLMGEAVECLEAIGGDEALAILVARQVDLVLLDLTMPGKSGFDVLTEMRRQKLSARVIVVSADIQRLAKERAASLGATGFIEKPINLEALRAVLTHLGVLHG